MAALLVLQRVGVGHQVPAHAVGVDQLEDAAPVVEVDGAVYRYTTNALEQAPVGGGGGGDATSAKQDTIIAKVDAVKAETAAIKAETATIVAKTAQLKFTVTNTVDTNITHVKGGAVSGTGQPGAEWGPT